MNNFTKTITTPIRITAIVVAVACAVSMASLTAKERGGKHAGDPYDKTGTVTRNEFDNCMEGKVKFLLHSAKNGKEVDRLSPRSKTDIKVLGDAAKNGTKVHVTGTWKTGLRPDCAYVVTNKCEPIKK